MSNTETAGTATQRESGQRCLVALHAHPDDEAISTGGTMARAHADGDRVVLVVATNGDHGEVPDDLAEGESLVDRRRAETETSAQHLGIDRIVWLGYSDSGMTGWEQNGDANAFCNADLERAARQLADVLDEEGADVLTTYDWHGVYGHPDHIQVHKVGARAGELAGVRVLEATMNRDLMVELLSNPDVPRPDGDGDEEDFDPNGPADDGNPFGSTASEISLAVDVSAFLANKRAAIRAHASQVSDSSFFLEMPDEAFAAAFQTEWYIEQGSAAPLRNGWVFDDETTAASG